MPSAADANPWILPLVLEQLSENPREPDLVGCKALVLSFIPQTRRMEIFDGAHILEVSLSVAAVEDLDRDEDALGITSRSLIGHIIAVAGLTLVPDVYSSPLSVIATVKKVTPFCDKLQRPVNRPPLVETVPEVRKILSARLGECFSSCVVPSFALNGSGGATGAASICQRSPGAPPEDLLRNISDFNIECARRTEKPPVTVENHDDLVSGRIQPPKSAASKEKQKPSAAVNVLPKPLPPLQDGNFASGAAAAPPPPLMPWAMARFSSGTAVQSKLNNVNAAEDNVAKSHDKLTAPASGSRPAASLVEKDGESQKPVTQRSSDGSSWSDRSPLPIVSMQESEDCDVGSSQHLSEAGPSVKHTSNANLNDEGIVNPDGSDTEQEKSTSKALVPQSDSDKDVDAVPQVPARQPLARRVLSAIEAAGAFATSFAAPRHGTLSADTPENDIREQRLHESSPQAKSPQPASVVAAEKVHGDTEEDGESTLSIPHDDLMQVEREVTQSLRQKKDHSPRRARSGMSAARNAARSAALALAGVRTPVNTGTAKMTEPPHSKVQGSCAGAANASNTGRSFSPPFLPEAPAGPSDVAASALSADKRDGMGDVDGDFDSLDDEEDEAWGSSHLPETQGNLEFAVGTVNLPIGSMESPKDVGPTRRSGKKVRDSNVSAVLRVNDSISGHVEVRREGEELVEETVEETGTVGEATDGRPDVASTFASLRRDGPTIVEKERDLKKVHDRSHQERGEDLIPRGQSESDLGMSPEFDRRLAAGGHAGTSRNRTKESACAMYEEAAKMMSRLRSLNRLQSSNPWHACLAPNSSLMNAADCSRNVDLLEQCVRKRRRSYGSVLSPREKQASLREAQECHRRGTEGYPRDANSGDGDEEAPVKRQRKSEHPKKAVDPSLYAASEADLVLLESTASCVDGVVAETKASGDVNFCAPVPREKRVDPAQALNIPTERGKVNPIALTPRLPATKVDVDAAHESASRGGLRLGSRIPLDCVGESIATRHWNAVKTDWTQDDFTRRMAVRNEARPGETPGLLSAADLKKLSTCVNAVVSMFGKDLDS